MSYVLDTQEKVNFESRSLNNFSYSGDVIAATLKDNGAQLFHTVTALAGLGFFGFCLFC